YDPQSWSLSRRLVPATKMSGKVATIRTVANTAENTRGRLRIARVARQKMAVRRGLTAPRSTSVWRPTELAAALIARMISPIVGHGLEDAALRRANPLGALDDDFGHPERR